MKEKIRNFLQVKERGMGLNDSIIFFCGMLVGWYILAIIYLFVVLL